VRHGCDGWCVRGIERWLADAIITAEQATQMRVDLPEPAHFNQLDIAGDVLSSAEHVVAYDSPQGISRDVRP
jgi:hypothetical protein